jgi:hypothetical protein
MKLVDVTEIEPSTYNPRVADPARLDLIELSLRKLGFLLPLYATPDGEIISGHQRHHVACRMGAKQVALEVTRSMDLAEAQRIIEATRTPLENYNKEMSQLNVLLEKGYINQETFGRATEQAAERLNKSTKKTGETIEGEFDRIGESMEGTIADSLDAISGRFDSFGDFFTGMLSDLNRALLKWALNDLGITGKGGFIEDIFGSIKGIFGGGSSSGVGLGGILGGIGDFFGGFFAEGGRLKPGQFGVVGERGPELAYAGNAPLNITPNSALGGGSPITINMNVQTPDVRSFRQSQSQIAADMARSIERARRNL